MVIYFKR